MRNTLAKHFTAIVAIAVFLIALAGCTSAPGPTADPKAEFAGEWDIIALEDENSQSMADSLQQLREAGADLKVILSDDGTAQIKLLSGNDDQSMTGTWVLKEGTEHIATITVDGSSQDAIVNQETGQLTMESDNMKMTCERHKEKKDNEN